MSRDRGYGIIGGRHLLFVVLPLYFAANRPTIATGTLDGVLALPKLTVS